MPTDTLDLAAIDPQRRQGVNLLGRIAKGRLLVVGFITALGTLGIDIRFEDEQPQTQA